MIVVINVVLIVHSYMKIIMDISIALYLKTSRARVEAKNVKKYLKWVNNENL